MINPYRSPRTVEEFQQQARILENAKKGIQRERISNLKQGIKNVNKRIGQVKEDIVGKKGLTNKGILGRFSKKSLKTQRRVTTSAIGIARGLGLIQPNIRGIGGRVGRPQGPSGKYYVPGKGPVGVYEWRKYQSYLRRTQALQGNAQVPQSVVQPVQQQLPLNQQPISSQSGMGFGSVMREPGVRLATPQSDNILNAPSFMKGEMIKRNNIEVPLIKMSPRPVAAPGQANYMDIDPASGRPILQRRVFEKWMTGEAL